MKFLIHSNHPTTSSGYGIQTAQLAVRLQAAGHQVAISAYFGQPTGIREWCGMRVYPGGFDSTGNDVVHLHAEHWFEGDPTQGWIITITDVFGLVNPLLRDFQVAAWTPVDHYPTPPDVVKFFHRTGARPIAMSQYGHDQLRLSGLDPLYVPLSFEGHQFHPRPTLDIPGVGAKTGRELMGVPDDAFVVMMNAMNKGSQVYDRKGFGPALWSFGRWATNHPDAVLFLNTELRGGAGAAFDLRNLAQHAGIAEHQIAWVDQYLYRMNLISPEHLAAFYTAADVLLAPSMGEGFCVPLVEAQACGTPVIVTDFSAQPELVGAGWKVGGQPFWNQTQEAACLTPSDEQIVEALDLAYHARHTDKWAEFQQVAVQFAAQYEADRVFEEHWVPTLQALDHKPAPLELDRKTMGAVAVIVPVLDRPQNVAPLVESFRAANDGTAILYFVAQEDDTEELKAIAPLEGDDVQVVVCDPDVVSFAQKVNAAYACNPAPWVFLAGDDVEFQPGWLAAARELSDRFDVIGTSDGGKNLPVMTGDHADHMFVRAAYIDAYGAALDGPGVVCHEGYRHFYVDKELVELAKRRGVFAPCLESVVVHNREREPDATDRIAAAAFERDGKTWARRQALIGQA